MYKLNRNNRRLLQRLLDYRKWLNAHWWQGIAAIITRPYEWTLEQRFKWFTRLEIEGLVWAYWIDHNDSGGAWDGMNVDEFYKFILILHLDGHDAAIMGIEKFLTGIEAIDYEAIRRKWCV